MKRIAFLTFLVLVLAGTSFGFNSGSTGADDAFSPSSNTVLQVPPDGIFNYTTVNIPAGVTVTFTKNEANTPVYILATGNVVISGKIEVNGSNGGNIFAGKGGPGGFDGGLGGDKASTGGAGLGPGGGIPGKYPSGESKSWSSGGGGGFGANGKNGTGTGSGTGGGAYSNEDGVPFIGGSGGGGGAAAGGAAGGGGGGGGAILIASNKKITVSGTVNANGGGGKGYNTYTDTGAGGGGSGGSIKLIADTISGTGYLNANGGSGGAGGGGKNGGAGGYGRIRIEASTVESVPWSVPAYTYGYPSTVFVAKVPTLRISSIGGVEVPENPSGSFGSPDITLPSSTTNPVPVTVTASNVPVGTTVTVVSVPEYGLTQSSTAILAGTDESSTANADITLSGRYQCILTVKATFTVQTAMYFEGEKIEKVRVASTAGQGQETTYITASGKEIPAEYLMAGLVR